MARRWLTDDMLGQRLFQQACAGCHLPNGDGRQSHWAALRGVANRGRSRRHQPRSGADAGTEIETSQGTMFMHAFTGAYTDEELAALGNYTIGQFGFRQGTITAAEIHAQRDPGTDRLAKPSS